MITEGDFKLEQAFREAAALWHTRLKAARKLRAYYQGSEFADSHMAEQEKEFKRKWWDACKEYEMKKKLWGAA